jgi:hypothetical protein
MLGSAAAGRPGNGGQNWGHLAEEVSQHNRKLGNLAPGVEPDRDPSPDSVDHLAKVRDELRALGALVGKVSPLVSDDKGGGPGLRQALTALSAAIQTAGDAVEDFRDSVSYELEQREADRERRRQYRSLQRRQKDQKTLRDLGRAAKESLTEARAHIDRLLLLLRG